MKSAKHIVCFCVLIIFCVCLPVSGQDTLTQECITIKGIVGKAEVRSSSSGKWRAAYVGMLVKMNWDVRTSMESSLELAFENGTVIRLGENSFVSLSTLLKDKSSSKSNSFEKVVSEGNSLNVIPVTDK